MFVEAGQSLGDHTIFDPHQKFNTRDAAVVLRRCDSRCLGQFFSQRLHRVVKIRLRVIQPPAVIKPRKFFEIELSLVA